MNSKEVKELMEAYAAVYAPQEIDESNKENKQKKNDAVSKIIQKKLHPSVLPSLTYGRRELKKEDVDIFDTVLEFLQVEGYAETLEEAEWMMANVIDEEAIAIILGEGHGSRTSFKKQSADERGRINMFKGSKIEYTPHKNYDPEANRGQGQILRPNQAEKQRRKKLAKSAMGEDYVNEAQVANRDPEKYEREQSKKYAPVRGEKTPMPPRGDKRREDFEKWYRANVR